MAPIERCLADLARLTIIHPVRRPNCLIPRYLAPALGQSRYATFQPKKAIKKKRPVPKDFRRHKLEETGFPQWTLSEAVRILRASEVGQPPSSVKYELHVQLKSLRNGPVIKGTTRLPHPVQSDWRIAVICPEGSEIANQAATAGAVAIGEESLFEMIRQERFDFDRLLCHENSEKALNKAGLGRILGPKGLMPSRRLRTIVTDVAKSIRDSAGASEYREREGVVRLAIGQLGFSPAQLQANIQVVMKKIKQEAAELSEDTLKELHEVILSTTNGPALSINGRLRDPEDPVPVESLSGIM